MKKILTVVLALVLVCGLAVTAVAAGFGVETDKDIIEAGEEVTVTVTLDETITADQGATALSGKLTYDESAVTLVAGSAKASDAYSFVTVTESKKAPEVKMAWFSVTSTAIELPAGTIMTVSFTANTELAAAAVEAAFSLDLAAQSALGEVVAETEVAASIKVCAGHSWTECEDSIPATCTEAGVLHAICENCGLEKNEEVPAEGHEYSDEWPIGTDNVLDETGEFVIAYIQHYGCWKCGDITHSETVYMLALDENSELYPSANTVEIAAGETVKYYVTGFGGYTLKIHGENLTVSQTVYDYMTGTSIDEVYTSVDGAVIVPISGWETQLYITNNGTEAASYEMEVVIPLGDWANPQIIVPGDNAVEIPAESYYGFYAEYIAVCDGTITFTFSGDYWTYNINNLTAGIYGDMHCHDDEVIVNSETIEVKAGDVIQISLSNGYTTGPWEWVYPASTISVNVAPNYTHEGHIVHVERVEPGCENEGNIEYWYCECCEMFWQDEALTQLTNSHNVILPITHKNIVHVDAVKPGCETEGNIEHWYCADCNMVWIDEALLQISNHQSVKLGATHWNIVHVEAVEPGCETEGNIEHWYCADCNIVWIDEALLQISNHKNVILPACHKNIIHMEAVAPGCHFKGHVEHWYCADCDMLWIDEAMLQISNHMSVILPELGGDVIHVEAKAPTCTEDGNIEHWYCEHCEQVWQDEARTQLTNHKNVIVGATGHVYGEDGVCTTCGDNPKAGDTTISLVVAAAVISAMSIVALPLVKKHF